jgi:ferredoxin
MHVSIDRVACAGVGTCAVTAPKVFSIDDDDALVVLLDPEPDESQRADVEAAVLFCPNQALAVEDQ